MIYSGDVAAGVAMLDEAMVAVGAKEVSAIATGDAYCTVIEGCNELFDVARAREWTAALSRWCEAQPELVLYRGQCLVHRAEILQLRGAWGRGDLDPIDSPGVLGHSLCVIARARTPTMWRLGWEYPAPGAGRRWSAHSAEEGAIVGSTYREERHVGAACDAGLADRRFCDAERCG